MIIEFVWGLALTVQDPQPFVTEVEFIEPIQQVIVYPPQGQVDILSGLELPSGTRDAFEADFVAGTAYFGAFAITKDFGYGFVSGANSLQGARDIALQECLKQGPRCLIYAEITPIGYDPLLPGQVTMSAEASEYYTDPDPSWGNYRAMAVSEDGAYSVVWNYGSPREASDAVLADCSLHIINDLPDLRDMPCVLIPYK